MKIQDSLFGGACWMQNMHEHDDGYDDDDDQSLMYVCQKIVIFCCPKTILECIKFTKKYTWILFSFPLRTENFVSILNCDTIHAEIDNASFAMILHFKYSVDWSKLANLLFVHQKYVSVTVTQGQLKNPTRTFLTVFF